MGLFLLFLSILPTIILGGIIYKNDHIEKEPTWLLIKLMLSGILSVILTLGVTILLEKAIPFFASDTNELNWYLLAIYVFFGVAIIEEGSKFVFTYLISWKSKAFDYVYDAIVYSVFVSLGFATIENILYIFGNESLIAAFGTAIARMLFSVPGHAFYGVFMGYYLGLAKLSMKDNNRSKCKKYLLFALLVPSIFHFIFDYLLMLGYDFSILLFFPFVIGLFIFGMLRVKKLSKVGINLLANKSNVNGNNVNVKRYCSNCGALLYGPYCSNCGKKID